MRTDLSSIEQTIWATTFAINLDSGVDAGFAIDRANKAVDELRAAERAVRGHVAVVTYDQFLTPCRRCSCGFVPDPQHGRTIEETLALHIGSEGGSK